MSACELRSQLGNVSRETASLLVQYIDLIATWSGRINLVSRKSLSKEFLEGQILDCAQIIEQIEQKEGFLVDIGSGAGLPGVVLSILGASKCNLVEINSKKSAFLTHVKHQLKLGFNVYNQSIEKVDFSSEVKYITSKAYSDLELMLRQTERFISAKTELITLKSSQQIESELKKISSSWRYKLNLANNKYNNGYVVKLTNLVKI